MIPVTLAKEPASFDKRIRQRGLSAIDELVGRPPRQTHPGPKRNQCATREEDIPADKFPALWTEALPEMLEAYERRCAYLAMYIHHATGAPTVDHVLPKSYAWDEVYEWDNYRLCAAIVNSKKGQLLGLVDPFEVGAEWFTLNLNDLKVERGAAAPEQEWAKIDATLPLLNHRLCVKEREEYVHRYRLGPDEAGISLSFLERCAPFIAHELRRQKQLVRGDA